MPIGSIKFTPLCFKPTFENYRTDCPVLSFWLLCSLHRGVPARAPTASEQSGWPSGGGGLRLGTFFSSELDSDSPLILTLIPFLISSRVGTKMGKVPGAVTYRSSGAGFTMTVSTMRCLVLSISASSSSGGLDSWAFQEALPTISCHCAWSPLTQSLVWLHNSIAIPKFPSHSAHSSAGDYAHTLS